MKHRKFPLFSFALVITLIGSTLVADDNDDRLFGNGRFLRRMRKENSANRDAASKKSNKTKAQAKGKTPTLAAPSSSKRKSNSKTASTSNQRSAKNTTVGFGMLIEVRNQKLIVTKIDRRGNAAEAGVKTGDVITGIGGVEIGAIEEFNQITDILGNGDQLEFQIARKGKPKKVLIQFGTPPKEGEVIQPAKRDSEIAKGTSNLVPASTKQGLPSVVRLPQYQNRSQSANRSPDSIGRSPKRSTNDQDLIQNQRLQIEQMQREILRLRQQKEAPSASDGFTILRNSGR